MMPMSKTGICLQGFYLSRLLRKGELEESLLKGRGSLESNLEEIVSFFKKLYAKSPGDYLRLKELDYLPFQKRVQLD